MGKDQEAVRSRGRKPIRTAAKVRAPAPTLSERIERIEAEISALTCILSRPGVFDGLSDAELDDVINACDSFLDHRRPSARGSVLELDAARQRRRAKEVRFPGPEVS